MFLCRMTQEDLTLPWSLRVLANFVNGQILVKQSSVLNAQLCKSQKEASVHGPVGNARVGI